MLLKKIFCIVLYFFALQLQSQNNLIKLPFSKNKIKDIESIVLQEKSFEKDTLALKNYLKPLKESTQTSVIYDALLANGYSNFYNAINKKSDFHYQQSIEKAKKTKNTSLEIWTQLNYVYYLYHHRDYNLMTPLLLKLTDHLRKTDSNKLILPGESFKKIGWMMQTLGDYENSLQYLSHAKKFIPHRSAEYAAILDAIGLNYFRLENLQEAESNFKQVSFLATEIKDKVRYAKALGNLALIEQKRGAIKKAISLVKQDIAISESENSDQNTLYASILLTEMYMAENEWYKAEETLQKAENFVYSKSYLKKDELKIIKLKLIILQQLNKFDGELNLRRRMLVLEDSLQNKNGIIALKNANWLIQKAKFDQEINKTEDQLKHESAMKNIYAIIILLALLLLVVLFLNFKRELKNKQLLHQQKIILFELEKIKTEKKLLDAHESLNSQIEYLKNKNTQIKKLKAEIQKIKDSSSNDSNDKTGKLIRLLESHLMTENNWNTFRREFQKEHPEFYSMLENDFPEITDSHKRILVLQKLNFSKNEIAELLGVTPDAIKKSKQRLKIKLGVKYERLSKYMSS